MTEQATPFETVFARCPVGGGERAFGVASGEWASWFPLSGDCADSCSCIQARECIPYCCQEP